MKRVITFLSAAALILSMAACGGNNAPTGGNTETPTQPAETTPIPEPTPEVNTPTTDADNTPVMPAKAATTLEIEKLNTVVDYAEFSLVRIVTTQKVTATMGDSRYYENKDRK